MQFPTSSRIGWHLTAVLVILLSTLSPLSALAKHSTATTASSSLQFLTQQHETDTVALTSEHEQQRAASADEWQITASQAISATATVTATRKSGLSRPKFTLPGRTTPEADASDGSESDDSESDDSEAAPTQTPVAPTATPVAATDAAEEAPIASLAAVRSAVVQIEAVGTFIDPAEGLQLNAAGRGSGFIIDPSGIAVTNNHVVTGGGLYKVYVAGEDEPRNAKVLGVSECADLAVIDIQGNDFPYLEWYTKPIQVGLDVYAVGFPLGDPEYTMTRGIVAKERANGESSWASVDHVIQHDASINPGNSGGPLVSADGQVVAVNYAGNSQTNQFFAIDGTEALAIIEQLRAGTNVDSIGINGEAFANDEGLSGHWVASVKSGSPADQAGIRGGDIILKLQGLVLGEDGSMSTYCDILRSHSADDVLAVQVLRFATEEVLEGQINGRELTTSFSLAEELTEESSAGNTETPATTPDNNTNSDTYSDYTTISDRTGILSLEVPTEWEDVESGDWLRDEEAVGIRLVAATDVDEFYAKWGYPGVIFSFSQSLAGEYTPEELLDTVQYSNSCIHDGRNEIPDGFFTGVYDIWEECTAEENGAIVMALVPETEAYILLLEIYMASAADLDALDRILDTFVVTPDNAPSSGSVASSNNNATLFDLVDTSGLEYEYTIVNEPALTALIPAPWADIAADIWVDDEDEQLGYRLSASADIDAYNDTWTTAGIYVRSATGLESELDIGDLLDSVDLTNICTYDDRYSHSHTVYGITYDGAYDLYSDCDGEANAFAYLVVQSDDLDHAVLLEFLAVSEADVEAFNVLLQSFYIGDVSVATTETEGTASAEPVYVAIEDATGTLSVRVPVGWNDIASDDWVIDGSAIGVQLEASPDLQAYSDSWSTPGLFFAVSQEFTGSDPSEVLDALDFSDDCSQSDRFEYDDSLFVGHYDLWEDCGGTETNIVFLAAIPNEQPDYFVLLGVQLPSAADFVTLDEIFNSFNIRVDAAATSGAASTNVPTAEVLVDSLNLRNGPGTNYTRIGGVSAGDQLLILGEYDNCAWLNVQTRNETIGWVAGNANFVRATVDCAEIPAVEPPPPPSNRDNARGENSRSGNSSGSSSSDNRATSSQGCYLFNNGLGPELTITFTRRGDGWNITFKVPADGTYQQCLDPGEYTYTIDAPPPWGAINGEVTVSAGDDIAIPITPGE